MPIVKFLKLIVMKTHNIRPEKPKTTPHHNAQAPDVRDNLDSRKNEEFDTKGDDMTHNKKETKAGKKSNSR
jgi:hypothetical protein